MACGTNLKRTDLDSINFLILCISNPKVGGKLNVDFEKIAEIIKLKSGTATYWRYKRLIEKETKGADIKAKGFPNKDAGTSMSKGGARRKKRAASDDGGEPIAKKVKREIDES